VLFVRLIFGPILVGTAILGHITLLWPIVVILLATDILTFMRHNAGLSGAFHMSFVVNTGLAIAIAAPSGSLLELAGLMFIAAQGMMGYFISGIAKITGSSWKTGHATLQILSTKTWGHPRAYDILNRFPTLSRHAGRGVVLFELLFPVILFVNPSMVIVLFSLAILMHLSISLLMGINGFLTSFSATYPAIFYVSYLLPDLI
jgi:hypothetical protein